MTTGFTADDFFCIPAGTWTGTVKGRLASAVLKHGKPVRMDNMGQELPIQLSSDGAQLFALDGTPITTGAVLRFGDSGQGSAETVAAVLRAPGCYQYESTLQALIQHAVLGLLKAFGTCVTTVRLRGEAAEFHKTARLTVPEVNGEGLIVGCEYAGTLTLAPKAARLRVRRPRKPSVRPRGSGLRAQERTQRVRTRE